MFKNRGEKRERSWERNRVKEKAAVTLCPDFTVWMEEFVLRFVPMQNKVWFGKQNLILACVLCFHNRGTICCECKGASVLKSWSSWLYSVPLWWGGGLVELGRRLEIVTKVVGDVLRSLGYRGGYWIGWQVFFWLILWAGFCGDLWQGSFWWVGPYTIKECGKLFSESIIAYGLLRIAKYHRFDASWDCKKDKMYPTMHLFSCFKFHNASDLWYIAINPVL